MLIHTSIANYAEDPTLDCEANLIEAQTKTETESLKVFEWFRNDLKQIATKSHVMLTTDYMVQVNAEGNKLSFGNPKVAHVDYVRFTCLK